MTGTTVEVDTTAEGTVIVRPHGSLGVQDAAELRRILVRAVRHLRAQRLILDLGDIRGLDSISLGALAATCQVGDDNRVTVYLDHASAPVADQLAAAGVPRNRLRSVTVR
jgi:anti-anti-sigma factor